PAGKGRTEIAALPASGRSGADGRFELAAARVDGRVVVGARREDEEPWTAAVFDADEPALVTLSRRRLVRITVTDGEGAPFERAELAVTRSLQRTDSAWDAFLPREEPAGAVSSAGAGSFEVRLASGSYRVAASAPGFGRAVAELRVGEEDVELAL